MSGILAPKPVSSFAHFNFDDRLMKAVRKAGYTQPSPIQAQVRWYYRYAVATVTFFMTVTLLVLLRPPKFHRHCGGWLPPNQHRHRGVLQCSRRSFWTLLPENCPSQFCRASIVIEMTRHLIPHELPQTAPFSTFYIAFHIFVVDGHRHFKFGRLVDHTKS